MSFQGPHHHSFSSPVPQTYHSVGTTAVLTEFGLGDLALGLEAVGGVNQVWNLLSLQYDAQTDFNDLDLWFEGANKVRHSETFCKC